MRLVPAYLGIALCIAAFVLASATVIGRAIDVEVQDRVLFTRSGVTLDCARHLGGHGQVSYIDCVRVP